MKKYRRLLTLLYLSLFINCTSGSNENVHYIAFKDSLNISVTKTSIHGKALLLNDSLVLYKTSKLEFESHNPKWLFNKTKNKVLIDNEYVFSPDISEVEAPYQFNKKEDSNIFQIIKQNDTLYFDFEPFDELDYTLSFLN
jgi:hypothetical protein